MLAVLQPLVLSAFFEFVGLGLRETRHRRIFKRLSLYGYRIYSRAFRCASSLYIYKVLMFKEMVHLFVSQLGWLQQGTWGTPEPPTRQTFLWISAKSCSGCEDSFSGCEGTINPTTPNKAQNTSELGCSADQLLEESKSRFCHCFDLTQTRPVWDWHIDRPGQGWLTWGSMYGVYASPRRVVSGIGKCLETLQRSRSFLRLHG